MMTQTTELMALRLGQDGYAFAKIDPVPKENKETKEVELTFFVDPGNRVYVRHINFNGSTGINDEVMRREMRQMEGGYLSNSAVERSKQRLQRLPYIEKVEVETEPVAGTPDLVDVNYTIKEGLPGQFSGGIGYSESQSILLNGSFVHSNFMGTGNRVAAEINAGQYSKVCEPVAHRPVHDHRRRVADPVGHVAAHQPVHQLVVGLPDGDRHARCRLRLADLGIPVAPRRFRRPEVRPVHRSEQQRRGSGVLGAEQRQHVHEDAIRPASRRSSSRTTARSSTLSSFRWAGHTTRVTARCSPIAARVIASASATPLPGSDVEYYTFNYDYLQFLPVSKWFTFMVNTELGYGKALGDTTSLPPYRNFFAGGPESVRGFKESRLGPKDSFGNPYGGNIKVASQFELLMPMPEKWRNTARFSAFFDIGNVFSDENINFVGRDHVTPVEYDFAFDKLRYSTGLAVQWLAPLGVFRFSFAIPLNASKGNDVEYKDETEGFQFSIGQAF